ncbi:MAG: hypothetical protein ACYDC7_11910, partial [Acidithiobacillus ferrivorans]
IVRRPDMDFDPAALQAAVALDADLRDRWRREWGLLMDLAVWGDLRSGQIGLTGKLRKRVLEFGERLRSYGNDRSWIPHPREQIKNALSTSLQMRESLEKLSEIAEQFNDGADLAALRAVWKAISAALMADVVTREGLLVQLLNQQYQEEV